MDSKYIPQEFEGKWIQKWEQEGVYHVKKAPAENKMYTLVMFPYPSGAGLHTGHARVYTGTDVLARFFRMKGYSTLHPMGWDAFGLPAENAAIKEKKNPMDMVPANIANFKRQMQILGLSYDWTREFTTTDPEYYKWTQWLFIQFFKMGLLYKKETPIYYCPFCKTGLAQEEVLADGRHERCGNLVEERNLPQWIFRITTYADRLLADLDGLDWPKGILEMQKNWIGKKEGMIIHHSVEGMDYVLDTFTAYPAWSFADTFIVVAPEHDFIKYLKSQISDRKSTSQNLNLVQWSEVEKYLKEIEKIPVTQRTESKDKTGVFTGFYAQDPFRPGKKMPIWIANFALMDFGTGAIRCSAHDPRDLEFAQKYGIDSIEVVDRVGKEPVSAHEDRGILKDSGQFTGREVGEIKDEFCDWVEKEGIGERKKTYHLRDWIFSRQRYWGEPIPMIFCQKCAKNKKSWFTNQAGEDYQKQYHKVHKIDQTIQEASFGWYPLQDQELPLELPYIKEYQPTETGESPLSQIKDWVKVSCPECGSVASRETDTMPNWAGSCWYFLYFASEQTTNNKQVPTYPSVVSWKSVIGDSGNRWSPVDWYIGGAEHAVLHLLYARFWVKAMYDLGLIDFTEPFIRLRNVGMVLAEDNRKMSKSLGNVVNPDEVISEFGADALRVYEMFMAPFNQEVAWSTSSLQGSYRFLKRIWQIYMDPARVVEEVEKEDKILAAELQSVIEKVSYDITNVKFNTAISTMMEFVNVWESKFENGNLKNENDFSNLKSHISNLKKLSVSNAKTFLKLLAPFAPFMTEEIWRNKFEETDSIHLTPWPEPKTGLLAKKEVTIPIQVNGKVRATITASQSDLSEEVILNKAKNDERVKSYIDGKTFTVIYIQGKIMNIVIK